jgi:hypothetical protein
MGAGSRLAGLRFVEGAAVIVYHGPMLPHPTFEALEASPAWGPKGLIDAIAFVSFPGMVSSLKATADLPSFKPASSARLLISGVVRF